MGLQPIPFSHSGIPPRQGIRIVEAHLGPWTWTRPSRGTGRRRTGERLGGVPQPLGLGEPLELLERVVLDLTDPLASHPEGPADLLQGPGLVALQPVAHLDHLALALR